MKNANLLKPKDVAQKMGTSVAWVYSLIKDGQLPAMKIKRGSRYMYFLTVKDVVDFFHEHSAGPKRMTKAELTKLFVLDGISIDDLRRVFDKEDVDHGEESDG